jgi:Domain of unknown function (DUF4864)
VLQAYPMVVRPRSVSYLQPQAADGDVLQTLRLRDRDGQIWLANYLLQRQRNGKWLINGCDVVADDERLST